VSSEPTPSSAPTPDDSGFVPPGDQPIGYRFPPPPASLRDLKVPKGNGAEIYLTFDDGPSPFTRQVLAALAEVDAPAVFCLVGDNAVARPRDVRAVLDAGHALCDHSRDHAVSVGGRNRAVVKAEINDALRQIRGVAGDAPVRYYRQPFGLWTPLAVDVMYAAGLNPLRWTDDPRDWSRPGKIAIAQRVLLRIRPGAVVLMHDGGGDRTQTVAALRWLLPRLRDAGWRFALAPVTHLSRKDAARPE
jgi:peptidoglycan/xylan/chitin deacetylase (PgdA/CDA1 family)